MTAQSTDAKKLFSVCFDTDEKEAEIIIGFAEKHGSIHIKRAENEAVNMICSCEITDGDFKADYLFACCTKPEFRNLGLFKKHLFEVIGDKSAVLLPENESLFPFYERLGFSPIYHLEVTTDAFDGAKEVSVSLETLFKTYQSSILFPKKDFSAFSSTVSAFLHYGGVIKEKNGVFFTVIGDRITEIFAESEEEIVSLLKNSKSGRQKLMLPQGFKELLSENKIEFTKNAVAMAKNLSPSQIEKIYLNNLFN